MVEGGILITLSDVVVVAALVIAIIVGALFVGGRIAPRSENTEPDADHDRGRAGSASETQQQADDQADCQDRSKDTRRVRQVTSKKRDAEKRERDDDAHDGRHDTRR